MESDSGYAIDRKLYLEAAEIWMQHLGLGIQDRMAVNSALRLGFALGCHERPEDFLPPVAVKAAKEAREQAREYRERQSQDLQRANVTEAMGRLGQYGVDRLW